MALRWKLFVASALFPLHALAQSAMVPPKDVEFERGKISLNGKVISVEIARTGAEHARGLMFRQKLPDNEGMLFVFKDEQIRSFWMKNTFIDLSIGYFNKSKTLVDVQEMKATSVMESKPPSYTSSQPAMYALEMTKGWFKKNKIKVGDKFQFLQQ